MCSSSGISRLRLREGNASNSRLRGQFDNAFMLFNIHDDAIVPCQEISGEYLRRFPFAVPSRDQLVGLTRRPHEWQRAPAHAGVPAAHAGVPAALPRMPAGASGEGTGAPLRGLVLLARGKNPIMERAALSLGNKGLLNDIPVTIEASKRQAKPPLPDRPSVSSVRCRHFKKIGW